MNQEPNNQQPGNQPVYPGEVSPLMRIFEVLYVVVGIYLFLIYGLMQFAYGLEGDYLFKGMIFVPMGIAMFILGYQLSRHKKDSLSLIRVLLILIVLLGIFLLWISSVWWVGLLQIIVSTFVLFFVNNQKNFFKK